LPLSALHSSSPLRRTVLRTEYPDVTAVLPSAASYRTTIPTHAPTIHGGVQVSIGDSVDTQHGAPLSVSVPRENSLNKAWPLVPSKVRKSNLDILRAASGSYTTATCCRGSSTM
jgi:hypothetical protein